mgnify:FL=1|tara:strand:- start:1031 stop:1417 length:387 start_codon:yes stop_codon:yes gene_type:complete
MALTKVNSAGVKDNEIVNADIHSAANITGSKLADDTITEVKLDVSNAPSAGKFLQYKDNSDQLTWAQASSPEVYGFNTSGSQLQVTTTNGGADNIDAATYASFDDVVFAATGITFTLDLTTGNLVATI